MLYTLRGTSLEAKAPEDSDAAEKLYQQIRVGFSLLSQIEDYCGSKVDQLARYMQRLTENRFKQPIDVEEEPQADENIVDNVNTDNEDNNEKSPIIQLPPPTPDPHTQICQPPKQVCPEHKRFSSQSNQIPLHRYPHNQPIFQSKNISHLINEAIRSNDYYDETLHVISVISNICEFKRRWELFKEFQARMEKEERCRTDSPPGTGPRMKFYVVELAYGQQMFHVTDTKNPRHLQLRTEHALWHKENMINVGVKKLFPTEWKAMAWIDADIEFDNLNWVGDTLKVMNVCDVAQMFSICFDMDKSPGNVLATWISHGTKQAHGHTFYSLRNDPSAWHCGYGFAYSRHFWDKMGGMYDRSIIGNGDNIMCKMFLNDPYFYNASYRNQIFRNHIYDYASRIKDASRFEKDEDENEEHRSLRVGYVPGAIIHHFHGKKTNRQYDVREQIPIRHKYDPTKHITEDENGIMVPTEEMPVDILKDLLKMFATRNEDE